MLLIFGNSQYDTLIHPIDFGGNFTFEYFSILSDRIFNIFLHFRNVLSMNFAMFPTELPPPMYNMQNRKNERLLKFVEVNQFFRTHNQNLCNTPTNTL